MDSNHPFSPYKLFSEWRIQICKTYMYYKDLIAAADALGISKYTLGGHMQDMYDDVGCDSNVQFIECLEFIGFDHYGNLYEVRIQLPDAISLRAITLWGYIRSSKPDLI